MPKPWEMVVGWKPKTLSDVIAKNMQRKADDTPEVDLLLVLMRQPA